MKKRILQRAFTLTELIVIVAVIGILATMIIPAFLDTTDRAKDKTDENTVATLNSVLESGAALKKDLSDVKKVREYLRASGYSDDKLRPDKTSEDENDKYCFVWDKSEEVILMIRLMDNSVIYPADYDDIRNDGYWYFLDREPAEPDCSDTAFPSAQLTARMKFTEQIEAMSDSEKEKTHVFVAKVRMEYEYDGVTYPIVENESDRVQTVYAVYDGTKVGTETNPLGAVELIRTARGNKYRTNTAADGWVLKYLAIDSTEYQNIADGVFGDDYTKETVDGSTFYVFTKLDGVTASGEILSDVIW